jgi:hypothetical protein
MVIFWRIDEPGLLGSVGRRNANQAVALLKRQFRGLTAPPQSPTLVSRCLNPKGNLTAGSVAFDRSLSRGIASCNLSNARINGCSVTNITYRELIVRTGSRNVLANSGGYNVALTSLRARP